MDARPRGQPDPCRTPMPTRGIRPCRKIVFSFVSRGECRSDAAAARWFDAALAKAVPGPGHVSNWPKSALHSAGTQDAESTNLPKTPSSVIKSS